MFNNIPAEDLLRVNDEMRNYKINEIEAETFDNMHKIAVDMYNGVVVDKSESDDLKKNLYKYKLYDLIDIGINEDCSREEFCNIDMKIFKAILDGDIYMIVMSDKFSYDIKFINAAIYTQYPVIIVGCSYDEFKAVKDITAKTIVQIVDILVNECIEEAYTYHLIPPIVMTILHNVYYLTWDEISDGFKGSIYEEHTCKFIEKNKANL